MCGIIVFNKDINASIQVYEGLNHLQHRGMIVQVFATKIFV